MEIENRFEECKDIRKDERIMVKKNMKESE